MDDLKDQARERLAQVWSRLQESSAFNNLREKYEGLPANIQKALAYLGGVIVVLLFLSIPYSYISSANVSIDEFTESRMLLRNLLRVSRSANDPSPLPAGLSAADLEGRAKAILGEFKLLAEQIGSTTPLAGERPAGSLASSSLMQQGVSLALKKLNLNQVLDIGHRLQSINGGVKVTGMDMSANADDNHYYDVTFRIVSFSLPSMPELPSGDGPAGKERKNREAPTKGEDL